MTTLDHMLEIATAKGCACGLRPCLVHFAEQQKEQKRREQQQNKKVQDTFAEMNDRHRQEEANARTENRQGRGPSGKQQSGNNDLRADRRGNGKGPGKAVRQGSGKRR